MAASARKQIRRNTLARSGKCWVIANPIPCLVANFDLRTDERFPAPLRSGGVEPWLHLLEEAACLHAIASVLPWRHQGRAFFLGACLHRLVVLNLDRLAFV